MITITKLIEEIKETEARPGFARWRRPISEQLKNQKDPEEFISLIFDEDVSGGKGQAFLLMCIRIKSDS